MIELLVTVGLVLATILLWVAVWVGFSYLGPSDGERERLKQYAAIQGITLGDIRPTPLIGLANLRFPSTNQGPRFFSVQFTEANGHGSQAVIALDLDYRGQLRVIRERAETA
jgi:hypothetical protein